MVLNEDDPTVVESLSILVEGDDHLTALEDLAGAFNEIHQPDNIETTPNGSLFITEDPSSNNQYALPRGPNETPARLWRVDLDAPNPDAPSARVTAAEVDQTLDERVGYDVERGGGREPRQLGVERHRRRVVGIRARCAISS